ncbi:MAG: NAD-dependent epimerase/dehydratase family protein [Verrucomicrobia bacterium]|nr:MAG: NAD-dependent epimerase/dehydratase family protein [Verrucomicrobiota bacterium]
MKVMVTGAQGFAGRHLLEELRQNGHTPLPVDLPAITHPVPGLLACDIMDAVGFRRLVAAQQPDACIHLGGLSFVPPSWDQPADYLLVNGLGAFNVLEALRREAPHARALVITSAEVYGRFASTFVVHEDSPFAPTNPYAVAKVAADHLTQLYARHHHLPYLVARPQNHIGPGQSTRFVVASFAEQIARIALGKAEPVIRVGDLTAERDFTDVRDVARAYRMLIERGRPGEAYNIAATRPVRVQVVLDLLCKIAGVQPRIEVEPTRVRPADHPPVLSNEKIRVELGWQPQFTLEQSLRDIYEHSWRTVAAAP